MSATSRAADLAVWVGGQIKAVRALAPAWRSKAVATTTTVALGTASDFPVTWDSPLPDASYLCWAVPSGSTGVTTQVAIAIKSQTSTGCVVTLRPAVALTAGYTFKVFAVRLPAGASNIG